MKPQRKDRAEPASTMDRHIIRVELPPPNAGVAAALKRAFAGAVTHQCEGDFDKLLRRLGSANRGRG